MTELFQSMQRATVGSPLRTVRGGCLFVLVMGGLFLVALVGHLLLWVAAPLDGLGVALFGMLQATLVSIPALVLVWYLDRRERETLSVMVGMIIWGAVIGTGISAIFNSLFEVSVYLVLAVLSGEELATLGSSFLTAAISAPLVEETAKGLGVVVVFWLLRAEFDNARDGIIYGALIGIGFNIAEFGLYLMNIYVTEQQLLWLDLLALRLSFFGLNSHMIWTALIGAGVGYIRQNSHQRGNWLPLLGLYVLAVIGHALNNSLGLFIIAAFMEIFGYTSAEPNTIQSAVSAWSASVLLNIIIQFIPYLVLITLLWRTSRWEHRIIREQLASEVGTAYLTPAEFAQIGRESLFGMRRVPGYTGQAARNLINAQNELAFRKWHVQRDGKDPEQDELVQAWRADILRHRNEHLS